MSQDVPIGSRIRFFREQRGRTQRALAQAADMSQDYLSEIERGIKVPTIATVGRLARELDVTMAALIEGLSIDSTSPVSAVIPAVQLALLLPPKRDGGEVDLPTLQHRVDNAWSRWQNSADRFTGSMSGLPTLITDVELARAAQEEQQRRSAAAIAVDFYLMLQQVCKYNGRTDLSMVASDRVWQAADESGDPICVGAAEWNLIHILRTRGEHDAADDVARAAIQRLQSRLGELGEDGASMLGSIHLAAAYNACQHRNLGAARQHVMSAIELADRVDETSNLHWLVFGRTNALIHAVTVEVQGGRAAEGFRAADHVDLDGAPIPVDRAAAHVLNMARLSAYHSNYSGVLHHLQHLEEFAPEDLRFLSEARDLVRSVATAAPPTYARQAQKLARRVGVQL